MKKHLLLLFVVLFGGAAFAMPANRDMNARDGEPTVTITQVAVTNTTFSIHCEPSANCASYKILAMTEEDIQLWSSFFDMTETQMADSWGLELTGDTVYTYHDMEANTQYKVFAMPYGADGTAYDFSYIYVTTAMGGGTGTSHIDVEVSEITDTSARVIFTPNAETALFYDGIIEKSYVDSIGLEAACNILYDETLYVFYETDDWNWTTLDPETHYYAIAFGKNGEGEWGDTTFMEFATLASTSSNVCEVKYQPAVIYPMPNNGNFTLAGETLEGCTAMIYSINGQLVKSISLNDKRNHINSNLPAGNYVLKVVGNNGKQNYSTTFIVK